MNWNESMQQIIDYIEENLQQREERIDTEVIARYAGCSYVFFKRYFLI